MSVMRTVTGGAVTAAAVVAPGCGAVVGALAVAGVAPVGAGAAGLQASASRPLVQRTKPARNCLRVLLDMLPPSEKLAGERIGERAS